MNKAKLLFILIITLFCMSNVKAQSHNMGGNYNCKLKKGNWFNEEKHACPACAAKDKKEKDAKLAEDNRRNQAVWDKAKADKIAKDKVWKAKQLEDAKNAHSGEVLINMPKAKSTKSTTKPAETHNYTCTNAFVPYDDSYFNTKRTVKILDGKKVIYESNDYNGISPVYGTNMFSLNTTSNLIKCVAEESNTSFLINSKGEKLSLSGIDLFGHTSSHDENDDYFEVVVFTGKCTPVENDNYAKGDWHTIRYVFNKKNLQLISKKPSWQHANCECQ
jgi:hypothetical protein